MSGTVPYAGVFASMDFPPYRYQEYPKAVKCPDGKEVVVDSQKAELDLVASWEPGAVEVHPALVERNQALDALIAEQNARQKAEDDHKAAQEALAALQAKVAEMEQQLKLSTTLAAVPPAVAKPKG